MPIFKLRFNLALMRLLSLSAWLVASYGLYHLYTHAEVERLEQLKTEERSLKRELHLDQALINQLPLYALKAQRLAEQEQALATHFFTAAEISSVLSTLNTLAAAQHLKVLRLFATKTTNLHLGLRTSHMRPLMRQKFKVLWYGSYLAFIAFMYSWAESKPALSFNNISLQVIAPGQLQITADILIYYVD